MVGINEFLNIIIAGVVSIGGMLMFYSIRKRGEKLGVETKQIQNARNKFELYGEQITFLKKQLTEAYQEMDLMQDVLGKNRQKITDQSQLILSLQEDMTKLSSAVKNMNRRLNRAMKNECMVKNCDKRAVDEETE